MLDVQQLELFEFLWLKKRSNNFLINHYLACNWLRLPKGSLIVAKKFLHISHLIWAPIEALYLYVSSERISNIKKVAFFFYLDEDPLTVSFSKTLFAIPLFPRFISACNFWSYSLFWKKSAIFLNKQTVKNFKNEIVIII